MSEPRVTSLLDFAITASVAVLPIMLGVVLVVAVIRPADPTSKLAPGHADRYLSVRHVAALKTFEQGVVRRDAVTQALPTAAEILAGLPQCRVDWDVKTGVALWMQRIVGPTHDDGPSEAQRM